MCTPNSSKLSPSAHFLSLCTQSKRLARPSSSEVKFGYFNSIKIAYGLQKSSRNGGRQVIMNVLSKGSLKDNNNDDGFYIRRCVELARKAVGFTSPNPMVGCVIVKDGRIVGEGYHPRAGQPHAEVFALRDAGSMAEDATAYVSLEPCNHHGRTPPCTEALIKAKVRKVVVGMVDPNPIVASKGLDRLRHAGIEVIVGIEEQLCQKLNEAFTHRMLTGKPFVILRYSISLDGHLLGEVGKEAMESGGYFSKLLQENDAVIHLKNPHSVVSSKEPGANQPHHILLASSSPNDSDKRSAEMSFESVLDHCAGQGMCSVVVDLRCWSSECDRILGEGFEGNLIQKVVVEVVPVWGGSHRFISSLKQSLNVKNLTSVVSGDSVLLEGYF